MAPSDGADAAGDGTNDAAPTRVVLKRYTSEVRMLREADALRRVRHPFVSTALACFKSEESHVLVLPYHEGGTFAD